jgi:hypothetical protein
MPWWWFGALGWGLIVWRSIVFMFPGLGLPGPEVGYIADFLTPWIAIGVGLLLKQQKEE